MPGKFYVSNKAVIIRDGKALILSCSKATHGDHWDFPGGRMEEDEPAHDGLQRELMEELPGIKNISIGTPLFSKTTRSITDNTPMVVFYFRVEADVSNFGLSDEHNGFRWAALEDINKMKKEAELFPEDETALRAALA